MRNNKKSYYLFVFFIFISCLIIGCSNNNQDNQTGDHNLDEQTHDENNKSDEKSTPDHEDHLDDTGKHMKDEPVNELDPIQEKIDEMTIEEKLGQMLIFGIDGTEVDETTRQLIQDYHVGGIILFKKNITDSTQLYNLNNQLKISNSKTNDIPLFISVDEEGGIVSRMPTDVINLPNSKEIGDTNDEELASMVGNALGERTKAFGFNMTMAPVLDVNSNQNNPVIGVRSFGNNVDTVSKMGIAVMKGIQNQQVISAVKHFPGHGDTSVDSHIGLPIVQHDRNRLNQLEFIPFQNAIHEGADLIMIAHILMPKLDANFPASLSQTIVTDILRKEIGFEGVIITDDMTMGAILENYDSGEAAVHAVLAGNDIILVCHGYENKIATINALIEAVQNGIISEERINESVYRILKLKEKYNLSDHDLIEGVDIQKINESSLEILNAL